MDVPVRDLDVSYGDSLAAAGMRRIADSCGVGVNVNGRHSVATFVWYRPVKTSAGGAWREAVTCALPTCCEWCWGPSCCRASVPGGFSAARSVAL
jgi:hypothetical protein